MVLRNLLAVLSVIWSAGVYGAYPASTDYVIQKNQELSAQLTEQFQAFVIQYVAEHGGGGGGSGITYQIGQAAQGGVVIWTTPNQQHGLVVALADVNGGATVPWAPTGFTTTLVGATANGIDIGANGRTPGSINTALIVALYTTASPYAALVATQYTASQGGVTYSDWFLPSLNEFGLIQATRGLIVAAGGTDLANTAYWSSFEGNSSEAWLQVVPSELQDDAFKTNLASVRAIRAF